MEKSQWDLKRIRFERRRLTRLDDFVQIYQRKHDALLREYGDVGKKGWRWGLKRIIKILGQIWCSFYTTKVIRTGVVEFIKSVMYIPIHIRNSLFFVHALV